MTQNPARTSSWSSATRTRIGDGRCPRRPVSTAGRSSRRQPGGDGEAPGGRRAHGEVAAAGGDPFGDTGQAEAGSRRAAPPAAGASRPFPSAPGCPGIGDAHRDVARLVGDGDGRPGGVRVPDRVGQRLLNDPVRGEVDAGGQRAGRARRPSDRPAARPRAPGRARRPGPRVTPTARSPALGRAAQHPSSRRSSVRACRAVSPIMSTDRAASSGRPGSSEAAASACTAIRLTWCATTSCSSRAIRIRSARRGAGDWRSSSASARSARLSAASRFARLRGSGRRRRPRGPG